MFLDLSAVMLICRLPAEKSQLVKNSLFGPWLTTLDVLSAETVCDPTLQPDELLDSRDVVSDADRSQHVLGEEHRTKGLHSSGQGTKSNALHETVLAKVGGSGREIPVRYVHLIFCSILTYLANVAQGC